MSELGLHCSCQELDLRDDQDPQAAKVTALDDREAMSSVLDRQTVTVFLCNGRSCEERDFRDMSEFVSFDFQKPHSRSCDQQTQRLGRVQGGPEGLHRGGEASSMWPWCRMRLFSFL